MERKSGDDDAGLTRILPFEIRNFCIPMTVTIETSRIEYFLERYIAPSDVVHYFPPTSLFSLRFSFPCNYQYSYLLEKPTKMYNEEVPITAEIETQFYITPFPPQVELFQQFFEKHYVPQPPSQHLSWAEQTNISKTSKVEFLCTSLTNLQSLTSIHDFRYKAEIYTIDFNDSYYLLVLKDEEMTSLLQNSSFFLFKRGDVEFQICLLHERSHSLILKRKYHPILSRTNNDNSHHNDYVNNSSDDDDDNERNIRLIRELLNEINNKNDENDEREVRRIFSFKNGIYIYSDSSSSSSSSSKRRARIPKSLKSLLSSIDITTYPQHASSSSPPSLLIIPNDQNAANQLDHYSSNQNKKVEVETETEMIEMIVDYSNIFHYAVQTSINDVLRKVRNGRNVEAGFVVGSKSLANVKSTWDQLGFNVHVVHNLKVEGMMVDDKLHLIITKELLDREKDQKNVIFVIMTGDGNSHNHYTSFPKCIEYILNKQFRVEVWSWKSTCSKVYRNWKHPLFSLHYLDDDGDDDDNNDDCDEYDGDL